MVMWMCSYSADPGDDTVAWGLALSCRRDSGDVSRIVVELRQNMTREPDVLKRIELTGEAGAQATQRGGGKGPLVAVGLVRASSDDSRMP